MSAEQVGRFQLYVWQSDNDDFARAQMTTSHENIEELGAVFRQDTFANRGSAVTWEKSFFYDTTNSVLYFSDGTNWKKLTDFGLAASIVDINPGDTASAGTSDQAARIDHRHAVDPWGTAGQIAQVTTSASAGSLDAFARADHAHVIGSNSVTAGTIASGAIASSAAFVAGVVDNSAIASNAVTKEKISTDQQIPSGSIMAYAGNTAPTGWLLCDGASYAKSLYPALWSVLSGQNYGSDTNNFNVPDLRDRIPRGATTTGTALGATAGADTVTIGTTHMPQHLHDSGTIAVAQHGAHSHPINTSTNYNLGSHDHTFWHSHGGYVNNPNVASSSDVYNLFWGPMGNGAYSAFFGGEGPQLELVTAALVSSAITTNSQNTATTSPVNLSHNHSINSNTDQVAAFNHTVSGNTGNAGGGNPLSVLPKTQTVNYIIKI